MGEPTQLPAPPPPTGPFYRVVEVRANQSERTIQEFPYALNNLADEQAKRAQAAAYAREQVALGLTVRIYSSDDQGKIDLQKDLAADSRTQT